MMFRQNDPASLGDNSAAGFKQIYSDSEIVTTTIRETGVADTRDKQRAPRRLSSLRHSNRPVEHDRRAVNHDARAGLAMSHGVLDRRIEPRGDDRKREAHDGSRPPSFDDLFPVPIG